MVLQGERISKAASGVGRGVVVIYAGKANWPGMVISQVDRRW
jgi:hypothetical protein